MKYVATKGSEVHKFIREICGKDSEEAKQVEAQMWEAHDKAWYATDRSRGPWLANDASHKAYLAAFNEWAAKRFMEEVAQ